MFRSKKKGTTAIAVFDISSSSVAGAHGLVDHVQGADGSVATMLASARIDSPLQEDLDIVRFVSDTVKNLEAVALQLQKADVHHPSHVQLVLASPWYVSQTRTISYQKDTPFLCSKKFFHSLVDAEIEHIIAHELERFGDFGAEGIVVEKQISLVKLNGYATADPFGKHARSIEIYLTVTVVPKRVVDRFTDVLNRAYGSRRISITTSPYATFVMTRDYFPNSHDSVIIDVGEEVTDVAFVKEGLFLYQHSFPVGTYGLYRALMERQNHTPAEAKALVEGYRLGKVSAVAKKKIDKALAAFSTAWQQSLQAILNDGQYGFCLPETCYIIADPRFAGVFPAIISTDPFIQHTCSRGIVRPVFLDNDSLRGLVSSLDAGELDVPLAAAILFVTRTL